MPREVARNFTFSSPTVSAESKASCNVEFREHKTKTGYVEAMAHSDNDDITGNWTIDEKLLYDHDGGHGMIFKDLDGKYYLVLHYPNTPEKEHPVFIELGSNW